MRILIATLAAGLALAGTADAQTRTPAERQTLTDLAYVLGQSHALRQACAGQTDQYWRGRMIALVAVETPDAAFDRQLKTAFNTGYAAAQAAAPRCSPDVRQQEAAAAARGRALAESLTLAAPDDDPSR